jgi:hypothetical protein
MYIYIHIYMYVYIYVPTVLIMRVMTSEGALIQPLDLILLAMKTMKETIRKVKITSNPITPLVGMAYW